MSEGCAKHIEEAWKQKTVASNELFNHGKYDAALNGYTEALLKAETLNSNDEDALRAGIPLVQVFIISCNNMANTYEELGQLDKAEKMLRRSVYFVIHLINHYSGERAESLHLESELKRTMLAYSNFCQQKKRKMDVVVETVKAKYRC
jgi:tetratricopeptide (TPR) repeat protein